MSASRATPEPVLFGFHFAVSSASDVIAGAEQANTRGPKVVVTANMDHIISLSVNSDFRAAYASAAVRTLDGMPLIWLAKMRGDQTVRRITGHDLLHALLARPAQPEGRLFVIAASWEVSDGITERFIYHGWRREQIASIVPPFGFDRDRMIGEQLARAIRRHRTTILLMGVGAPKSEIWVTDMGQMLGAPLVLCVGDSLAVAAGLLPRAPKNVQRLGLEWLWRFMLAPRRLFYRYFVRSWRFPVLLLRNPNLSLISINRTRRS